MAHSGRHLDVEHTRCWAEGKSGRMAGGGSSMDGEFTVCELKRALDGCGLTVPRQD